MKFFNTVILFFISISNLHAADIPDKLELGKAVYDKWCIICHGEDNPGSGGGTQALKFLYQGSLPAKLEDRSDMSPEFIETLVRKGRLGMPNFRLTEINHQQLNALIAYLTQNNM